MKCFPFLVLILMTAAGLLAPAGALGAIQCFECHGSVSPVDYRPLDAAQRTQETGGFPGNHRTHLAEAATPVRCDPCHPGSGAYTASHRNGYVKLAGHINGSLPVTAYRNTTTASPQSSTPVPGSCTNVNCHFETTTPAWGGDPSSTTCSTCHGAPPADGSHPRHHAYYGPTTSSCLKCHRSNTTFSHATSVGRGPLDLRFTAPPNDGGTYSGTVAYPAFLPSQAPGRNGTCSEIYCHTPGTRNGPPYATPAQSPVWGSGIRNDCSGCHKGSATSFTWMTSGSHNKHVYLYNRIDCTRCHSLTAASAMVIKDKARHLNRLVDVAFDTSSTAVSGRYNGQFVPVAKTPGTPYGTCDNVYCHSNGQNNGGAGITYRQPVWGDSSTGRCGKCHDVQAGHNFSGNEISSGSHPKHLAYNSMTLSPSLKCTQCHNLGGQEFNTSCNNQCHSAISTKHVNHQIDIIIPSRFGAAARYDGSPNPGSGYSTCTDVYCHSGGAAVATGSVTAAATPLWGAGAMECNGCHGNRTYSDFRKAFPLYTTNRPATKANSHSIHAMRAITCRQCHLQVTTDNVSVSSTQKHVNGAYDVNADTSGGTSFSYGFSSTGGSCSTISCHAGTGATWGKPACLDCHSVSLGNRAAITAQFASGSHHVQGEVTSDKCYHCHWEAQSDGSINAEYHSGSTESGAPVDLVIYGVRSRPVTYTAGVTAVQYRYTALVRRSGAQAITTHCIGCHRDDNDTITPFGDGKTPRQYAWDGSSVASRYSQAGTTTWGKYSTVRGANKRAAKAFSAHGNATANRRGWSSTTGVDGAIPDTGATISVQCYDCHNSHGSAAAGITSRYSSATGRNRGGILKTTTAGKGGYAVAYRPYTGGSAARKDRRNPGASLCVDCHLNSTPLTTPWGYASTFGAGQPIAGYWDNFRYGSYTTAGSSRRYPFKGLKSFMGGHFGASSPLAGSPGSGIDGLCTPCHDPHGVSTSLGANQEYAVPLLKGTWLTSPYREDTAPASTARFTARGDLGEGVPYFIDQNTFGSGIGDPVTGITLPESRTEGLCLGCHPRESLTAPATPGSPNPWKGRNRIHETVKGWKTSSATVKHAYSCSKCHAPHNNSVLPRLMVTNCLDSRHKGRTGWSDSLLSGSGSGQAICCVPVCSEIPYSFRNPGAPAFSGGYGWCGSKGGWAAKGSGGGRLPGSWRSDVPGTGSQIAACHEDQTGSGTDQSWNQVTPWTVYPPLSVTAGPAVSLNGRQGTVTWTTSIPGSSTVRYGTTVDYGSTATGVSGVRDHSVTLSFINHATNHYQVATLAGDGQQIGSADATVYVSEPPSVPTLILKTGTYCAASCSHTLQWNPSSDPDGGTVEYQLQLSSDSGFGTLVYDSGWITATSAATSSLGTNATYWWRVRARDAAHTTAQDPPSAWSASGSFPVTSSLPTAPTIGTPTMVSPTSMRWSFTDTSNNEDGFRLHDAAHTVKGTAGPNASFIDETGLTANTQYTRHLHAYNAGGESAASADVTKYTMPLPAVFTATAGQTSVTFSTVTPFGSGGVAYYRYVWDNTPTHSFNFGESYWYSTAGSSKTLNLTAGNPWYLHIQAFNQDSQPYGGWKSDGNPGVDFGPYYYDTTAPGISAFTVATPTDDAGVPVTSFVASDNIAVTGYMVTTWSSPPSAGSAGWSATPPSTVATGVGTYTLYPWVKDGAGNVSPAFASPRTVTVVDVTPPSGLAGLAPANAATDLLNTARLECSAATDSQSPGVQYWFQIARDAAFTTGVLSSGWQSGTSYAPPLAAGTTYYWRVKTRDAAATPNETPFTVTRSFSTFANQAAWTTRGDFSSNASTTGGVTVLSNLVLTGAVANDDASAIVKLGGTVGGQSHTLAIKAADGTVWAWGYNSGGQLGNGGTSNSSTPVQASGLTGVTAVAAGSTHSLALKTDGTVWAWGYTTGGSVNSTTPVKVSSLSGIVGIAAGTDFSLALKTDGTVWAWGINNSGQLGNNSTSYSSAPVQVLGGLSGVSAIAAGTTHSLALKSDGTVWAWGYNGTGQIGDNTVTQRNAPVQVQGGLSGAIAIAAGYGHSVALTSDGTVWVWGDNLWRQLGDGTTTQRNLPVRVQGLSGVAGIAARGINSLALKLDGTVWAWGDNGSGQLGDGTTTQRNFPVQVQGGLSGIVGVAQADSYSLALKSNGTIWAWGYNYYGQFGNGTTNNSLLPTQGNLTSILTPPAGVISGLAFDAGSTVTWGSIQWQGTSPVASGIRCRTRGAADQAGLASATWSPYYTISGSAVTTAPSRWLEVELSGVAGGTKIDDLVVLFSR